MKKLNPRYAVFVIIFLFSMLFSTIQIYASGAGSQSDSPGTPGQKPLNFISCTLKDGSSIDIPEGITLQPEFKFTFDKNVVNMLVWENNSKCFSLYTSNVNVPIIVSKIDDTVDFSSRQFIFMHPVNALEPGKTYTIRISPDLLAKNLFSTLAGTTDGKGITLTFKTKGQAVNQTANTGSNNSISNSGSNTGSSKSSSSTSSGNTSGNTVKSSAAADQSTSKSNNAVSPAKNSQNTTSKSDSNINKSNKSETFIQPADITKAKTDSSYFKMTSNNWIELISGIAILCWILIEFIIKRRLKKERTGKPLV